MASSKNANNTVSNSAGNEAGGFKTVAFGFDKNDVTLYIASLRKKMKAMEEEFEQKLAQALENPAVSNDALNHEREVIRAQMEKQWNDKIVERTSIIKSQQEQINELEKELAESNNTIQLLQTQLSAATGGSDPDAGSAANAKAAEAYVRFTAELRSISESAQRTLASIEQIWSGESGISSVQEAMPAAPSSPSAVSSPAPVESKKTQTTSVSSDFDSLIADDDSIESLISDINGDDEVNVPIKSTPVTPVAPAAPVAPKAEYSDDLSSLLADSDSSGNTPNYNATASNVPKGDDLDADLLSNIVISPGEQNTGEDLGEMLKEKEQEEFDAFKDLFITDDASDIDDSDLSNLTVTPVSDAEIKPGISTEFDLTTDDDKPKESDDNAYDIEVTATDANAEEAKAAAEPPSKNKEEDLFDFSFLAADDDEDDMSSDVSFNGML